MKTLLYVILMFVFASIQAQEVYRGKVCIKQNTIELQGDSLILDMDIALEGLSVGRYQSLSLTPMLVDGRDSLSLAPILLNGRNKQKMYKRELAFDGETKAKRDAYVILKNEPSLLIVSYKKNLMYQPWMENAQFVLVGELLNYNGIPVYTYRDILTEQLRIYSLSK